MLAIPFKISPFCIILYLFDPHQHCVFEVVAVERRKRADQSVQAVHFVVVFLKP